MTSPNDVVAETIGGVIGVSAWLLGGQRATDYLRKVWAGGPGMSLVARLGPVYLAGLVLVMGMPFDLTISPVC